MQLESESRAALRFRIGDESTLDAMLAASALVPFADPVLEFFGDLSRNLMQGDRSFSDVTTFGFWCRKSALLREKAAVPEVSQRLGRGIVFHSTPSNVPVNFAFSFAAGLLAGNANIVRLPAKDFPQVEILCDAIQQLIETKHLWLKPYVCLVKFPTVRGILDYFSSICTSRVIWGGDGTVAEIRKSPLPPRANEITFADRFSIAVMHSDAFLASDNKAKIAQDFYNDTYFSDQNACTSPRILIWLGQNKADAQRVFWSTVHDLVKAKYQLSPVQSVGKLTALCLAATRFNVTKVDAEDQYIYRLKVDRLVPELLDYKYHSGFFFEYDANTLEELLPVCTGRCQTLAYYGVDSVTWEGFISRCRPFGIDRIVPIGKTMDFSLVWDGYDLIRSLSRKVSILS